MPKKAWKKTSCYLPRKVREEAYNRLDYQKFKDHNKQLKKSYTRYYDRALKACGRLFWKASQIESSISEYHELSSTYIAKMLNNDYKTVFHELVRCGIIEEYVYTDEDGNEYTYSTKYNVAKKYRLDPSLCTDCEVLRYEYYDTDTSISGELCLFSRENLKRITFGDKYDAIITDIEEQKPERQLRYFKQIFEENGEYFYTPQNQQRIKGRKSHRIHSPLSRTNIKMPERMPTPEEWAKFLAENKTRTQIQQTYNIHNQSNLRSNRNKTNNRLDSNLTNYPNQYIKKLHYVNEHGELEQLALFDLKNSQFALLANVFDYNPTLVPPITDKEDPKQIYIPIRTRIINQIQALKDLFEKSLREPPLSYKGCKLSDIKTTDLGHFKRSAKEGRLYELLADVIYKNSAERNKVKNQFYKLFFGPSTQMKDKESRSDLERKLPNVVALINAFKGYMVNQLKVELEELGQEEFDARYGTKSNRHPTTFEAGNNSLAIELQRIESMIFIDLIYRKLKDLELFALSMHDGIIFRKKDKAKVESVLKAGLAVTIGHGNFKLSYEEFEEP